jgi:hypothetical protein
MLQGVNVAATFPEEREVQLYDLIGDPVARLGRWALRRRRGVSDADLHATAYGLIADFEELLSLPRLAFRTRVLKDGEEPSDESEEAGAFNALLLSVRRCRGDVLGPGGQALERALKARRPELSDRYLEARGQALEFLAELERMLVLFGAGTEEDAELGMPLIPTPPDMPPGPTVHMEL